MIHNLRLLIALFCIIAINSVGRTQSIFTAVEYNKITVTENPENVTHFKFLEKKLFSILAKSESPTISVNYDGKIKNLELTKANILSKDYALFTSTSKISNQSSKYVFYRGKVKNKPHSKVSLMYFDQKIHLSIFDEDGNYEINPFDGDIYAGYYSADMVTKTIENWSCELIDKQAPNVDNQHFKSPGPNECVSIFIEIDHNMYGKKGSSVSNTEAWALNLMSQVAILFMEYDVPINISGIQVWDTPDPYVTATNTSQALGLFRTAVQNNPNNNGRLAHLLSGRSLGGGIAYLNSLCSTSTNVAVSANLNGGVVSYPNYSWNVMVISHELGHNMGSNHTHACAWNGNNTAIDGCYSTEGSCSQPPIPSGGGTIMSYCHLTSQGINLNKGFGPQPGALIHSRYTNASCTTGENCTAVPPFNDVCARAKEIPVLKYCVEGSFHNDGTTASDDGGAMSCGETGTENDIWFSFDFPSVDTVTLEFNGANPGITDLIVELYQGACSSLSSFACDSTANGARIVTKLYDPALVGQTIYIRLAEDGSDAEGDFSLCIYSDDAACGADLDTLVNLYNSLIGNNWTNKQGWDAASSGDCNYCSWHGVTCDFQGNVIEVDLSGNNLAGKISEDLQGLSYLTSLNLENNMIGDSIPNFWDSLDYLVFLDLSDNQLIKEIPMSFKSMTAINTIYLDNNLLTGKLPNQLGYNSSLYSFSASSNNLEGCFSTGTNSFCYRDSLNLDNNPLMVFGGDVTELCANFAGLDYDMDEHCSKVDDCNDYDETINESAPEVACDALDNNCNGEIDEGSNFGPNIWIGIDTLGNWRDSSSWSLGYPPKICEIMDVGMNGDIIHLVISSSQYEQFKVRGIEIGTNATLLIDTLINVSILGGGTLENNGEIIVDGYIQIQDQLNSLNSAIYNDGLFEIRSTGGIGVNDVGEFGIENTSNGIMNLNGYSFIGSFEESTAKSAIVNDGAINVYGYLSIYGEFQNETFKMGSSSTMEMFNGAEVYCE